MDYKGRCVQCIHHRCQPKNCQCDCHQEYENAMKKIAKEKD